MIFFGHLGLTYAAARTFDKKVIKEEINFDYRFMFVGSILPDLLDKTIIFFKSNETFKSGRLFGHTLLFTLILLLLGFLFWKKKRNISLLVLAAGCVVHDILDSMWNYLDIYFWPVYGLPIKNGVRFRSWLQYADNVFNKINPEFTLSNLKERLATKPVIAFAEVIGFLIILVFVINLIRFKQVYKFIRKGQFSFKKS